MARQKLSSSAILLLIVVTLAIAWIRGDFSDLLEPAGRSANSNAATENPKRTDARASIPSTKPSVEEEGSAPPERRLPTVRGVVDYVQDGDSLILKSGSEQYRVRFWGIDAPEGNTKQPFAREARDCLRDLCQGKRVRVEVHDTDRYGRKVGEVFLEDGRSLNREMVSAGLAWHYAQHAREEKVLGELEASARQARRGLWKDDRPTPPWQWRQTHPKPE